MAEKPLCGWKAGTRALVERGAWKWALALGFAIALGGGAWAYDVFGPDVRRMWPTWKAAGEPWLRETVLWIEFLASITLSMAVLCWCTALFFCLLCVMLFGMLELLERLSGRLFPRQNTNRMQYRIDGLWQHDRLWGSVLNLLASLGALGTLTKLLNRSLDYWDVGIQVAISTAIELIVFEVLFARGRFGRPGSSAS